MVPVWLKTAWSVSKAFCIAHGPAGLVVGGLVVGGIALVSAIKSAKKDSDIEDHVRNIEIINNELKQPDTPVDRRKELKKNKRKEIRHVAGSFLKLHGKTLALALLCAALVSGGFAWEAGRLSATSTALAGTSAALNTVRENVRKMYGEDGVRALSDPNFDAEKFKSINAASAEAKGTNGAPAGYSDPYREYYNGQSLKINNVPGSWIFMYDGSTVREGFYEPDPIRQIQRLQTAMHILNLKLQDPWIRVITVNDVLKEVGLDDECSAAGQNIGWVKGEYIDFGINDYICCLDSFMSNRELSGSFQSMIDRIQRNGIQLVLNPGGPILDAAYRGRVS